MANRRLSKQVEKLEDKAEKYRSMAEAKADKLASKTSERAHEAREKAEDVAEDTGGGRMGLFALVLAAVGGVAFFLKKRREQELDEALWEEPRAL